MGLVGSYDMANQLRGHSLKHLVFIMNRLPMTTIEIRYLLSGQTYARKTQGGTAVASYPNVAIFPD